MYSVKSCLLLLHQRVDKFIYMTPVSSLGIATMCLEWYVSLLYHSKETFISLLSNTWRLAWSGFLCVWGLHESGFKCKYQVIFVLVASKFYTFISFHSDYATLMNLISILDHVFCHCNIIRAPTGLFISASLEYLTPSTYSYGTNRCLKIVYFVKISIDTKSCTKFWIEINGRYITLTLTT